MTLRLWIGSSNTKIFQGRSTWPCHTSSAISQRNSFQPFTTSTSTRISSSLICIDHTTLQLSPRIFKVVQNLHYCTDRLRATSSPAPWWKPVAVASLKYRVTLILDYLLVSHHVHARIGWNITFLVNISSECFTFFRNGAGKHYHNATNNHYIWI